MTEYYFDISCGYSISIWEDYDSLLSWDANVEYPDCEGFIFWVDESLNDSKMLILDKSTILNPLTDNKLKVDLICFYQLELLVGYIMNVMKFIGEKLKEFKFTIKGYKISIWKEYKNIYKWNDITDFSKESYEQSEGFIFWADSSLDETNIIILDEKRLIKPCNDDDFSAYLILFKEIGIIGWIYYTEQDLYSWKY